MLIPQTLKDGHRQSLEEFSLRLQNKSHMWMHFFFHSSLLITYYYLSTSLLIDAKPTVTPQVHTQGDSHCEHHYTNLRRGLSSSHQVKFPKDVVAVSRRKSQLCESNIWNIRQHIKYNRCTLNERTLAEHAVIGDKRTAVGRFRAMHCLQYPQGNNLGQIKSDMMNLNTMKIFAFFAPVWQRNPSPHPTLW